MKIAQYDDNDRIRLGLVEHDALIPIDFPGSMIDFIKSKPSWKHAEPAIALDKIRFAPAVSHPSKIIAIGLNYADHIQESKGEVPEIPMVFAKFPNTLIGHNEPITWNTGVTRKVDFEAELAVIIGKKVSLCQEEDAMESVFGYTCANDVSARDLQFADRQWVRGKSLDTFCPLGPWIVTREHISDPHNLRIRCIVNDQQMQDSNTSMMIFKLPQLLAFLSNHFTLFPGDLILTGTPSGVGSFRNPSIYLKHGDKVVVEIEKIGRLENRCKTT
ncbi:MAG: fumarylacetoacetate hydrolase family protein [Desulfobacteraceae bacterium]|jgi:2-keto-4-pentenoate hydratase/2-oxohepta-3-ene-1,7-dioic acid hydratase in catechol pathway